MGKKLLFFVLFSAGLLMTAYFLQPLKKGTGLDATVRYEPVENWLHLPDGLTLGNPAGIDLDTGQNVVVFHRAGREWPLFGSMPDEPIQSKTVLIINKDNGKLIDSWGDHLFIMPHGLKVDKENNVWVTDVGLHQIFKFSHGGRLLLKLGTAKIAGNDSLHFDKPTDVAVANDGSFYVSDGYGNSRIVKFSAAGKYMFAWGGKGDKENEFNVPHGITLDNNGNVYVADRENHRIQVFTSGGKFIKQFAGKTFGAICSVAFDETKTKLFAADDFAFLKIKHRGSDVFVFDTTGKVQTRFGRSGPQQGAVSWYHDVAVDKDENVYAGDIIGNTVQKFRKVSNR